MYIAMNRFKVAPGSEAAFEAWTRSDAFRAAHRNAGNAGNAGQNRPMYLSHPEFEGFEVVQTVK